MEELKKGLMAGFVDGAIAAQASYMPHLVSNKPEEGKKVLSVLEDELKNADEFFISVAFITKSGITPLLETFKELEKKGIKGKIITTDYLNFTEPDAIRMLASLKNIDVKMYMTNGKGGGFHTKGYIFKRGKLYRVITGSSNMTQQALTINKEWNSGVVSGKDGTYAKEVISEYSLLWNSDKAFNALDVLVDYETRYKVVKEQKKRALENEIVDLSSYSLSPNSMQVEFIKNIDKLQKEGKDKALLISATGTGKTFASAFALREMGAKRVLFVVHREQILNQSKKSFKRVFNKEIDMGLVSGNEKNWNSDFVFSTVQTMSKEESLRRYKKDEFDYIVIDEVHRAGGESYQKIINYFTPKFLLGMTASPERSDGFDIYGLFGNNIAHEIRLEDALKEDLLCPFHYFGITDFETESTEIAEGTPHYKLKGGVAKKEKLSLELKNFKYLCSRERVEYIIENIKYYSYSGDRVKGLVFCSRNGEAKELSDLFNERGFKTIALSGKDTVETRINAVKRLTTDSKKDYLDYIFTVDIFNEGVDIPEINQVVMLRPTQSPIVFVQQLGRGLRKAIEKEYVVIIDFIGNYQNNYMIPVALSGDKSYNKDNIRKTVREGNRTIPGCSSIHFDQISRQRIYKSIDVAKFKKAKLLKEEYENLKNKLGKVPSMMEFEKYGSIDILLILEYSKSYYDFLKKAEKNYTCKFDETQEKMIRYVSLFFGKGKRKNEIIAMKYLLNLFDSENIYGDLIGHMEKEFKRLGKTFDENKKKNIINILTNNFLTGGQKKTYKECVFIEEKNGKWGLSKKFILALENKEFFKMISETISLWKYRNKTMYGDVYLNKDFCLYKKYDYNDVCRLLNWDKSHVALNIGGYKFDQSTNTFPVFINYEKSKDISDTTNYQDRFISNSEIIAISKSKRTINSDDVQKFLNAKKLGISIDLFVRKNKDDKEAKEFYYMGEIAPTGEYKEITMGQKKEDAVEIFYNLQTSVRDDIYDYIVN